MKTEITEIDYHPDYQPVILYYSQARNTYTVKPKGLNMIIDSGRTTDLTEKMLLPIRVQQVMRNLLDL